ncbi:MAG: sugar ABC transporter permease [Thermodesulfobacteriota bacterium]
MTTLSDEKRLPWLLMTPALLIILLIGIFPLFFNLFLSLHFWNLTRPELPMRFIWFDNYISLFKSALFWGSFGRTMLFLAVAVTLEMALGFGLALLFNRDFKGKSMAFPIILIPMITTPIVVGLIWRYMYNGEFGFVSWIMTLLGSTQHAVLSNPSTALPAVIFVDVWHWTPFVFLLALAGLRSLPNSPFEAAEIDGASSWQVFKWVTFPMMRRVLLVALLLRTMDAFKIFDEIFIMTQGGPGDATEMLSLEIYRQTFRYFNMGKGASLAIVMLAIIIIISRIYLAVFQKENAQG